MPATQRAVWRNGGSNSAEIDVRTRTAVARRTCSESRRCAKPPVVVCNRAEVRRRKRRADTNETHDFKDKHLIFKVVEMKNQIEIASEVNNSSSASTSAHETRKNKQRLAMFVIAALALSVAFSSCSDDISPADCEDCEQCIECDECVSCEQCDECDCYYTVTYMSNGVAVNEFSIVEGSLIDKPKLAPRDGYKFDGWYTDDVTFANVWDFAGKTVTDDVTLYANWHEYSDIIKLLGFIKNGDNTRFEEYEYDDQNRITKISFNSETAIVNPFQTNEFTYNAEGDLVKFERKDINSPSNDYVEEYVKSDNIITITNKVTSGRPDLIYKMYLNNDGYPSKYEHTDLYGNYTVVYTYYYQDDNLTRTSQTRTYIYGLVERTEWNYVYDNKNNPRSCTKTPEWAMIWHFGTGVSRNNVTNSSGFRVFNDGRPNEFIGRTDSTLEYDSDGFPTKVTSEDLYGYKNVTLFEYE